MTLVLWLYCAMALQAQESSVEMMSFFNSLYHTDAMAVTITTDQKKLIRDKKKENYQPATISYVDQSGQKLDLPIEIKTRGNMRLKTCYYPPLRIKLTDEALEKAKFKDYPKLKLVVACKGGDSYEQLLLREYLAYRINNIITEQSFKVQLLMLTMVDSEGKSSDRTSYAFAIEDQDELAARLGGILYEPKTVSRRSLETDSYDLLALFQYLIGNTDWFVLNQHNTKFVRSEDPPAIIPIAYDFDFAGLVNAPYAVPNEKMPIKSVQDRFFIGDCREETGYGKSIELLKKKKKEIFDLVADFKHKNERSHDYVMKYLTKSFEVIEDDVAWNKELKRGCGWTPMDR